MKRFSLQDQSQRLGVAVEAVGLTGGVDELLDTIQEMIVENQMEAVRYNIVQLEEDPPDTARAFISRRKHDRIADPPDADGVQIVRTDKSVIASDIEKVRAKMAARGHAETAPDRTDLMSSISEKNPRK